MDINVILAWAGLVVGIIGIPIGYLIARRGRQRPDLRSASQFDEIISSEDGILDRLNMEFDGKKIFSVSRTRLALWNARGDTVRGSDILPADRLRLQLESDDLALHVRVIAISREQIDAICEIDSSDPTAANISFDFLDASDGFIVELLHMKAERAELVGTIRGAVVKTESGTTNMSPDALDKAAARWLSRIKHTKRLIAVPIGGLYLTVILFIGMLTFAIVDMRSKVPMLVDVQSFDLKTLDGQRDFATSVGRTGNVNDESTLIWVLASYCAVLVLGVILITFLAIFRVSVPRSIVRLRPDSSGNSEEAEQDLVER
jgi:hypothetical protein